MYDNAELFRYLGELSCLREKCGRVLLSGAFSAYLSSAVRAMYPESEIVAVSERHDVLEDARREDPSLITVEEPFWEYAGTGFDIAVSVLAVQSLDTRELTPYLFNLHDALTEGGNLYLSFPSTGRISPYPKKLVDSWYSMDEKVYMKRYTPEDMIMALSIVGFDVKAIESDDVPDLEKVISIHASRRIVTGI